MKNSTNGKRSVANKAPVAIGKRIRFMEPRFLPSRPGCMCVEKWEYLKDISGSTSDFSIAETVEVNPGISASFPWLSGMARLFESYQFKKLDFELEPMAPTSATGTVALVPEYNPEDSAPLSKVEALEYESAVRSAPWDSCKMVSSKKNLSKRTSYFCRSSSVPSTATKDLYDTGVLYVCVGNQASTAKVSELWVHYIVEFLTPQYDLPSAGKFAKVLATSGLATSNMFGSSATVTGSLSVSASTLTLTFNESFEGLLTASVVGTGLSALLPSSGTATYTDLVGSLNGASTTYIDVSIVRAAKGQTVVYTLTATTVTSTNLRIASYDYDLAVCQRERLGTTCLSVEQIETLPSPLPADQSPAGTVGPIRPEGSLDVLLERLNRIESLCYNRTQEGVAQLTVQNKPLSDQ